MRIGKKEFDLEHEVYVMGILNVTPDSFSDGGKYNSLDLALRHTEEMIEYGADVIDIGGESTRPGYGRISDEEEILRVIPIMEEIKSRFDIPISIDTYKSKVAKAALDSGVDMINDIWGLKYDEHMAQVIAEGKVPCCLMHNRKNPTDEEAKISKEQLMADIKKELKETVDIARQAGIHEKRILLDPGIGFGKTHRMNLQVMNQLEQLQELGYPLLLGTSRKSMIGLTLDLPAKERVEGTIATSVLGVQKGCCFFRVHDVKENKRAIQMAKAILDSCK